LDELTRRSIGDYGVAEQWQDDTDYILRETNFVSAALENLLSEHASLNNISITLQDEHFAVQIGDSGANPSFQATQPQRQSDTISWEGQQNIEARYQWTAAASDLSTSTNPPTHSDRLLDRSSGLYGHLRICS
jgi:hypothetical protein